MSDVDGKVKRFPPIDMDYVNFFDLVVLFKELGYVEYKEMYWYDILAPDMESGFHPIKGDHEINEMRENKLKNRDSEEFYIYFDHSVNMREVIQHVPNSNNIQEDPSDVASTTQPNPSQRLKNLVVKPPPPPTQYVQFSQELTTIQSNPTTNMLSFMSTPPTSTKADTMVQISTRTRSNSEVPYFDKFYS
ncbi:hypothetical protein AHAS_Ahas05G0094100 [Arachis hypogaea]